MVPREPMSRNHSFYCMFWMVPEEPTDGSKRAHLRLSWECFVASKAFEHALEHARTGAQLRLRLSWEAETARGRAR